MEAKPFKVEVVLKQQITPCELNLQLGERLQRKLFTVSTDMCTEVIKRRKDWQVLPPCFCLCLVFFCVCLVFFFN